MPRFYKYYKSLSWLLLLVYILNPVRFLHPIINYSVNYKYISETLCINKEKPELACHGKCYLSKEIKQIAQADSTSSDAELKIMHIHEFQRETSLYLSREDFLFKESKHCEYEPVYPCFFIKISTPPPQV